MTLPPGLSSLTSLDLRFNWLTNLSLCAGLTQLTSLYVSGNPSLKSLTLPPDLTTLVSLLVDPSLTSLVLSEPLSSGPLSPTIGDLRNQGAAVFVYPLRPRLIAKPRTADEPFRSLPLGPPGIYRIQASLVLSGWEDIGPALNENGSVWVTDPSAAARDESFYRALMSN